MQSENIGAKIQLWSASLDVTPDQVERFTRLLAPDEWERAKRFHFDRHRRRFIARRAFLRMMLGHYLNVPPGDLTFQTRMNLKPALVGGGIEFSLSHSEDEAVFAFARASVGVDIERIRSGVPYLRIARSFTRREQDFIATRPLDDQLAAFYSCWTCKEACVKALGVGLAMPLDGFDVTEALAAAPAGVTIWLGNNRPRELWLASLMHLPEYSLAVAVESPYDGIEFRRFDPLS